MKRLSTTSLQTKLSPFVFGQEGNGDGVLALQAAPYDLLDITPPSTNQNTAPLYASGLLTTFGIHTISPPVYVEARARMPYGKGTFPAIWLLDENLTGGDEELDIVEYYGQSWNGETQQWSPPMFGNSTWETLYHTYHDSRGSMYQTWTSSGGSTPEWCETEVLFPDEFHTFGLLYTAEEVIWYVDGIQTMRIAPRRDAVDADVNLRRMPSAPMYLIFNLAMDASWFSDFGGQSDSSTCEHFNVDGENQVNLAIDYVRVYTP